MTTYRIICREDVYFVKEVEANSEDEAVEKLHENVNGFKTFSEWTEAWEIMILKKEMLIQKHGQTYTLQEELDKNHENLVSSWNLGIFLKSS